MLNPIFPQPYRAAHPNPDYMAISKFLRSTKEQIERFQDVKRYSKKLMAFRNDLAKSGVQTTFNMYEILNVRINCPVHNFQVMAQLREYNSQDILLTAVALPYTILFENCETGLQLAERMRESKLIAL